MTISQEKRMYFSYCPLCFLFGKCKGPETVKDPSQQLMGGWGDIKETDCRKFQEAKPPTKLAIKQSIKKGGGQ